MPLLRDEGQEALPRNAISSVRDFCFRQGQSYGKVVDVMEFVESAIRESCTPYKVQEKGGAGHLVDRSKVKDVCVCAALIVFGRWIEDWLTGCPCWIGVEEHTYPGTHVREGR